MPQTKVPSNSWAPAVGLESALEESLTEDFQRVISVYEAGEDKSYEAFCNLAQTYGVTLTFHWCAPNTSKKPCHTREYADKIKYVILQTAKSFWLCSAKAEENCPHHPGNAEERFWRQVGGLFLVHILYGAQPSLPGHLVKIDVGVDEIPAVEKFATIVHERVKSSEEGPEKDFYEGLRYIYTRLKVEGALRPTVIGSELRLSLLNFKT